MYKILSPLILSFLLGILATGCSMDNSTILSSNNSDEPIAHSDYTVVIYNGKPAFSFKDNESMISFADKLTRNGYEDGSKKAEELGVNTYYGETVKMNAQIDSILALYADSTSSSIEVEKTLRKYRSNSFSLCDSNPEILYIYSNAKSYTEASIANVEGIYLIANQPIHIECYDNFEEASQHFILSETILTNKSLRANAAFGSTNKRNVRMILMPDLVRVDGNILSYRINMHLRGLIKGWFGWNDYKTLYFGKIQVSDVPFPFLVTSNYAYLTSKNGVNLTPAKFTVNPKEKSEIFIDSSVDGDKGATTFTLGTFIMPDGYTSDTGIKPYMKGKMEVWSRGVPMSSKGVDTIDIDFSK